MRKTRKTITTVIVTCVLIICLSLSVFAASTGFSASLPMHQGDTEVSTVRKAGTSDFFVVTINSIGSGTSAVCVWTENATTGYNYSSPYHQMGVETEAIFYSTTPSIGTNVSLNMDNPVYLDYSVPVSGSWDPH